MSSEQNQSSGNEEKNLGIPRAESQATPELSAAPLKPFTNYECSVGGAGSSGHKGLYTGAYRNPSPNDATCTCGALMVEEGLDGHRYRVEFETVSPHEAAEMEARYGKGVWPTLRESVWNGLSWCPVSREDRSESGIRNQYERLKQDADTRRQPIRNVRMLRSKAAEWEPATNTRGSASGTT